MKIIVICLVALSLTGCGAWDRSVASMTGTAETCIDGVKYLQFTSGATVKYAKNRQIELCE